MISPPPGYDTSLIRPIRPPRLERVGDAWRSSWRITTRATVLPEALPDVATEVGVAVGVEVALATDDDDALALVMTTVWHPLDVEAWPVVDRILVELDDRWGLIEINGSPRDWWRPFRRSRPT